MMPSRSMLISLAVAVALLLAAAAAQAASPVSLMLRQAPKPQAPSLSTRADSFTSADAIRDALDISKGSFVSADLSSSDPQGVAVLSDQLNVFPTKGSTYLVLSSGLATDAWLPNSEGSHSTALQGSTNELGNDLTQVRLELNPPADAKGLEFNAIFLSEEFPEFVGSSYNDAFTAEMGQTALSVLDTQVYSPYNFAYDTQGNPVSVNTVYEYSLETGTTYDGATALLDVAAPLERDYATGHVVIYLTVQDLSDSWYDSTVFLDNFRWRTGPVDPGAQPYLDSDGDALPDDWETKGVDCDGDGKIDLNLPAMGAKPNHKDVFIEIDWMEKAPTITLGNWKIGGHQHQPKPGALKLVIDAFRFAPVDNPDGTKGITAHIDAGPLSVMNPVTGAKWGARSAGGAVPETKNLGSTDASGDYDWSAFDVRKNASFQTTRADVFHYCLFAHRYGGGRSSGISRNIPASDFIVADGAGSSDNLGAVAQAGTLMHEFGHNLGLWHGGGDGVNDKPNYLSVMNYSFQFPGLFKDGQFGLIDYSRGQLDDLDESALDETLGLTPFGLATGFGTLYYDGGHQRQVNAASGPIDWDRNGSLSTGVAKDLNKDSSLTLLVGYDDWAHVRFDGGAVGMLGDVPVLDARTVNDEPTYQELNVARDYGVSVRGGGVAIVRRADGRRRELLFTVTNTGQRTDRYKLSVTKFRGVDASRVPSRVALRPGQTIHVKIGITLRHGTKVSGRALTLTAKSVKSPTIADQTTLVVRVKGKRL